MLKYFYLCVITLINTLAFGEGPLRQIHLWDHYGTEYFENGDWHFVDTETQTTFLNLDNETVASTDDVALDPFLAIRTKIGRSPYKIERSLEYFARFEMPCVAETNRPPCRLEFQQKASSRAPAIILNEEYCFVDGCPYFLLNAEGTHIHWQISAQPFVAESADSLTPNFQCIQEYTNEIILDAFTCTFFNPKQTYYFRAKALDQEGWTSWSEPYAFIVDKPEQVREIAFSENGKGEYVISWEGDSNPHTHYHIFASNALDFIPTLYSDQHVLEMQEGQITDFEPNQNHLLTTDQTEIRVDSQYAYYRIVAERNGVYSVPSPIIRFYANDIALQRNVLQTVGTKIRRTVFGKPSKFKGSYSLSSTFSIKRPEKVSEDIWDEITPYLMPENHPVKEKLDRIFQKSRATSTMRTMEMAGFSDVKEGKLSHITVARHEKLKGYLLKLFRDEQKDRKDWKQCVKRTTGAEAIREAIYKHGYQKMMRVPHKWIYCIPESPAPKKGFEGKHFILVVEDMHILSGGKNSARWRSHSLPRDFLRAVFTIINEVGLLDSVQIFNIPFCKDGRIAFIDTEYHHKWPIAWRVIKQYLCGENQEYWEAMMKEHGIP